MSNRAVFIIKMALPILAIILLGLFFRSTRQPFKKAELMKNSHVENIFLNRKTVCVGRFLIDVPQTAEVIYGPAEVPFRIDVYKGKGNFMETIINDRLTEVDKERRYAQGRLQNADAIIGKVLTGVLRDQKLVFGVSQWSGVFYRIQSYLKIGDDIFVQEVDAIGKREEYEKDVDELNAMARLLRSRSEQEMPQTPGVCIENGFVTESSKPMREYVTLGIRLAEFPDVHFSMSTTNKMNWVESDALEPRIKQAEENARVLGHGVWYSRIKTFRRGQRQLGSWQGFEILARLPGQKVQGPSHEFRFLSQGKPKNPLMPMIDLGLRSGVRGNDVGGVDPSLSDEEAILLWDRLTSSIRLRPVTTN